MCPPRCGRASGEGAECAGSQASLATLRPRPWTLEPPHWQEVGAAGTLHQFITRNEGLKRPQTWGLGPGAQGEDSDRFWSSQGHRCPHLFQPDLRPAIRLTRLGQHSKEARLPGSTSRCAHDKGEAAAAAERVGPASWGCRAALQAPDADPLRAAVWTGVWCAAPLRQRQGGDCRGVAPRCLCCLSPGAVLAPAGTIRAAVPRSARGRARAEWRAEATSRSKAERPLRGESARRGAERLGLYRPQAFSVLLSLPAPATGFPVPPSEPPTPGPGNRGVTGESPRIRQLPCLGRFTAEPSWGILNPPLPPPWPPPVHLPCGSPASLWLLLR